MRTTKEETKEEKSKLEVEDCPSDPCPESLWTCLRTAILQTSAEVLGFFTKKNKDWFDENDHELQELLARKRRAHLAHLAQSSCPAKKAAFRLTCGNLQRKLRVIQNELNRWAEHFQTLFSADRTVDDAVIQQIPQEPVKEELDEP